MSLLDELAKVEVACLGDQREKTAYINFLTYQTLKAYYNFLNEDGVCGFSWATFLDMVKHSKKQVDAVAAVVRHSVYNIHIIQALDFDCGEVKVCDDYEPGEDDGILQSLKIFSEEEGNVVIDRYYFLAEMIHFHYLCGLDASLTWEKYTKEIIAGKEVWEQLRRAFVNSMRKLDYRAVWLDDSIPEIKALGEED